MSSIYFSPNLGYVFYADLCYTLSFFGQKGEKMAGIGAASGGGALHRSMTLRSPERIVEFAGIKRERSLPGDSQGIKIHRALAHRFISKRSGDGQRSSIKEETEEFPLTLLPRDLLRKVFTFLPPKDLGSVHMASKECSEMSHRLLQEIYPIPPKAIPFLGGIETNLSPPRCTITLSAREELSEGLTNLYQMQRIVLKLNRIHEALLRQYTPSGISESIRECASDIDALSQIIPLPERELFEEHTRALREDVAHPITAKRAFLSFVDPLLTRYRAQIGTHPPLFTTTPFIRGEYIQKGSRYTYFGLAYTQNYTAYTAVESEVVETGSQKLLFLITGDTANPKRIQYSNISFTSARIFFPDTDPASLSQSNILPLFLQLAKEGLYQDKLIPANQADVVEEVELRIGWKEE